MSWTCHCSTLARLELNCVNKSTYWNLLKSGAITRLDIDVLGTRQNSVTDAQTLWAKDVCLCTVCIVQKSDTSGTVRIVLNGSDFSWNVILATLEVDTTVLALVATTLVTGSDAAIVVATSLLWKGLEKGLLGLISCNLSKV